MTWLQTALPCHGLGVHANFHNIGMAMLCVAGWRLGLIVSLMEGWPPRSDQGDSNPARSPADLVPQDLVRYRHR